MPAAVVVRMRIVVFLSLLTGCAAPYDHGSERGVIGGKADDVAPRKSWTFLYYGAADNNLATFIVDDIDELERVGSSDRINLVAFVDTPAGARRFYLEQDDRPGLGSASHELGRVDSGSPVTLISFLQWGIDHYPADRIAVVVSGHGLGHPRRLLFDDGSQTSMSVPELAAAIRDVSRRIDLVGADACLLGTIEAAFELAFETDVIVASENFEDAAGWPYTPIAADLAAAPEWDARQLGDAIVARVDEAYPWHLDEDATLSAIDLQSPWIQDAQLARDFAMALEDGIGDPAIRSAVDESARTGQPIHEDYLDYWSFAVGVRDRVTAGPLHEVAARVVAEGNASFIRTRSAGGDYGFGVYFPLGESASLPQDYVAQRFVRETGWDRFLGVFAP